MLKTSPSSAAGPKPPAEQNQEQQPSSPAAAVAASSVAVAASQSAGAANSEQLALHTEIRTLLSRLTESGLNSKELIRCLLEKISKSGQNKEAIKLLFDEINKLRQDNKNAITETLLTEIGKFGEPGKPGKKVVVLVESGRGSGRTTFVKAFQKSAEWSLKFLGVSIIDRDSVFNSVTMQAPLKDETRTDIYLGLLAEANNNVAEGGVVVITGDWGAQYPVKSVQEKIEGLLAQRFVVLRLRLVCSPEKQYERVLKRHRSCPHSKGTGDECDHARDADIYDKKIPEEYKQKYNENEVERFNLEVNYANKFFPDYQKRNTRNALGDEAISSKFKDIPLLEIDTNVDWKIDTNDGNWPLIYNNKFFEVRDPKVRDPLAQFAWFIVLHRLMFSGPPTSPLGPTRISSAMGVTYPQRPRSNSSQEIYFPATNSTSPSTTSSTYSTSSPEGGADDRFPAPCMIKVLDGRAPTPFPFPNEFGNLFLPPAAFVSPASVQATLSVSPRSNHGSKSAQTTMLHDYPGRVSRSSSSGSLRNGAGVGLNISANLSGRRSSVSSLSAGAAADYAHTTAAVHETSTSLVDGDRPKRSRRI